MFEKLIGSYCIGSMITSWSFRLELYATKLLTKLIISDIFAEKPLFFSWFINHEFVPETQMANKE